MGSTATPLPQPPPARTWAAKCRCGASSGALPSTVSPAPACVARAHAAVGGGAHRRASGCLSVYRVVPAQAAPGGESLHAASARPQDSRNRMRHPMGSDDPVTLPLVALAAALRDGRL